jgi:two-component system, LytTR family, response regulator
MMRVLVVDDEPIARRRILRLLGQEPDVVVIGECGTGEEAVNAIRDQVPDLVFLDVQMPGMDGFGVLDALGTGGALPHVIFVTAFDEYAIRAFEVHALDYLLKPFGPERFQEALRRARTQVLAGSANGMHRLAAMIAALNAEQATAGRNAPAPPAWLDRVMVKSGGRILFLRVEEIAWVEAEGNYLRLHTGRGSYLVRETIRGFAARLDPTRFVRIHRSTIVNMDRVREMVPWFGGDHVMILEDGTELKVSRGFRGNLPDQNRGGPVPEDAT